LTNNELSRILITKTHPSFNSVCHTKRTILRGLALARGVSFYCYSLQYPTYLWGWFVLAKRAWLQGFVSPTRVGMVRGDPEDETTAGLVSHIRGDGSVSSSQLRKTISYPTHVGALYFVYSATKGESKMPKRLSEMYPDLLDGTAQGGRGRSYQRF